jgi:pimeloyl-ACP methyl ester carboxylesterase
MAPSARGSGDPAGPAVVLLHGGSRSSATWNRLAAVLAAAGRHVIAAGPRGHGSNSRTRDYRWPGTATTSAACWKQFLAAAVPFLTA